MLTSDRRVRTLAYALSSLAGFVDAIGFIALGGFFVSFMSGNTTRAAVGIVERSSAGLVAAGLILIFVVGVVLGSLLGRAGKDRRKTALLVVAALLSIAAALASLGFARAAIVAATLAMGAENTVFERDGEVQIGLTYMTGTLVKLGQRVAGALAGGERWAWIPYLLLWLGLLVGAVAGAAMYPLLGLQALWIAAVVAAALAFVV